ncbi:hypothetical protein DSM3645_04725 [Blastopirellula marina DSM 3645]|uniref:Uncharacterized protein n=1 Tax=Blastopirellula marina DSM 3645 TaxID=314230 RepID=A4A1L9_9BACT|nr:hypothetical protein DSM3645_04725 [Blastopirellula marina DSM 3645]
MLSELSANFSRISHRGTAHENEKRRQASAGVFDFVESVGWF